MEARVALLLLAALACQADRYPRQAGIDVEHYAFRIALSDSTNEIQGETRVDFQVESAAVDALELDFAWGMTVDRVSAGDAPLSFAHRGNRLRIGLPAGGARRSVTVQYHGAPTGGLRIGPNAYGERTFFSSNWPDKARHWLPVVDHPYDKATSEFLVTAPAKYQVVANGVLAEELDLGNGRRLTHWRHDVPIAVWLNAIGVAQFSVRHIGLVRGIPISNWVYPRDRDKGMSAFDAASRNAMEFFSEFVAPYPYGKLANVEAASVSGGMEHASAIFYGEKSVAEKAPGTLVAHEIAHQWFGNSVTESDWDDVWLSEGFATYFAYLCVEHVSGRDAFVRELKRSRATVVGLEVKLPGVTVVHDDLADTRNVLNGLVYQKGAWTLHMLRARMGMEAFRAGIREYYRQFQGRNATTSDFQRVMEQAGGEGLSWFFDQWLRRPGIPELQGRWRYDAAAKGVRVELRQVQAGAAYRLPLEVRVGPERVARLEMTKREQEFVVASEAEPGTVELDPNTTTLMKADFRKQ